MSVDGHVPAAGAPEIEITAGYDRGGGRKSYRSMNPRMTGSAIQLSRFIRRCVKSRFHGASEMLDNGNRIDDHIAGLIVIFV